MEKTDISGIQRDLKLFGETFKNQTFDNIETMWDTTRIRLSRKRETPRHRETQTDTRNYRGKYRWKSDKPTEST